MKVHNEYSQVFGPSYDKTPKAVYAAIALSLANRLMGDNFDLATKEVFREWSTLHENGIIPQSPKNLLGDN